VTGEINRALSEYRFNDAANSIYQFIWHELCDWYLEMAKPILYDENADKEAVKKCLMHILETTLRLLHPFMPYVTEEIWQKATEATRKNGNVAESIAVADFPLPLGKDHEAESEMNIIMETIMSIRTIRGELNIPPSLELKVYVKTLAERAPEILNNNLIYLRRLAKADIMDIGTEVKKPKGSAAAVRNFVEVYIPLEGLINVDLEIDRLKKEETKIEQEMAFLNKKLLNEDFLSKAPKDIVVKEKEKYNECLRKKEINREHIKKLYEVGGKQ
jgi:valyl-tRNA synthetase